MNKLLNEEQDELKKQLPSPNVVVLLHYSNQRQKTKISQDQ